MPTTRVAFRSQALTDRLGRTVLAGVLVVLALALGLAPALRADDRELLGVTGADPYVFILFDISGSMNWQPGGDRWAPAAGDDPASKFYQAKAALFEVLRDDSLGGVSWGFATYNQDQLLAYRKHWLYTATSDAPWVTDGRLPYPALDMPKVFGDDCMDDRDANSSCDLDSNDIHGWCGNPRDVDDFQEWGELRSFPVLDDDGATDTQEWILHDGRVFLLEWALASGNLGDETIDVDLRLREASPLCFFFLPGEDQFTVTFRRALETDTEGVPLQGPSDFLFWQNGHSTDADGNPSDFFSIADSVASNTCAGWDSNTDTGQDNGSDVALRYPTVADPDGRHVSAFDRGDVVPLDWRAAQVWQLDSRDEIARRLAPNFDETTYDPDDPTTFPEFRVAPYFEDHPDTLFNGRLALLPEYSETPPLLPFGSTPIGNSMEDFLEWFDQWKTVAVDEIDGDPLYDCRSINLLILTDGDETCYQGAFDGTTDPQGDVNPCWVAQRLFEESGRDVKSYVVGFGVPDSPDNFLSCIADKGGTAAKDYDGDGEIDGPGVIFPQNKDELVEALKTVIQAVQSDARSFASASVPSLQTGVEDKIFLSSFRPVDDETVWDGHLDAFLRPLPLDANGLPDESVACAADVTSACHLWDSAEEMLLQAPTEAEVEADQFRIGNGADERRVWYAQAPTGAVPAVRTQFLPPTNDADRFDLWMGMGLPFSVDPADPAYAEAEARANAAIRFALRQKTAQILAGDGSLEPITYVLGDIFHSTPRFVSAPDRFDYFAVDLYDNGQACDDPVEPNPGYRCFFERRQYRRKMVVVGANDGQFHAFDAGLFSGSIVDGEVQGEFDNGTGSELFGWVPRPLLPGVVTLAEGFEHEWTADGNLRIDDVFVDPVHDGTPVAADREWRTVAVAGLREGGRGYFALDITQPDVVDADGLPQPLGATRVPSCTDGGAGCGPLPFPSMLWEFTEDLDEDLNGSPDLGETWSTPNVGRVRVCTGAICDPAAPVNDLEDRFVAVVGGGLDAALEPGVTGNYIYLLDIETGLPLYKRPVTGAVPGEPAAVDTDLDGYIDTLYFGTTEGVLYKVQISTPALLESVLLSDGSTQDRVLDAAWDPYPIFVAGPVAGGGAPVPGGPVPGAPDQGGAGPLTSQIGTQAIFFSPSVIFVAELGRYAIAFGTGDREDLWSETGEEGRFYLLLDDDFAADDPALPLDESVLEEVPVVGSEETGGDVLLQPNPGKRGGWYFRLELEERVITTPFALSGVTVFTAFQPDFVTQPGAEGSVCAKTGTSRIFVVLTTSGNGAITENQVRTRFWTVDDFVTDPYTELSVTKNEGPGGTGDELTPELIDLREELKALYPENCEFANYDIHLKTLRSDTGVFFIAPIPVCLVEKNWREF